MGTLCAIAALLMGGAVAGSNTEITVQDDALMLHRPLAQVRRTARDLKAIGADRVRITAGWGAIAPQPESARPPRAFRAEDPDSYPAERWQSLDTAVRAARDAGLDVQLDLAFWAPRWAVERPTSSRIAERHRDRPDPRAFGAFAAAVARRYDGRFPDPAARGRALPAVRLWTTWNEPNHPSFLQPQWQRDRRGHRPASPHVYRALHEAAYGAVKSADPGNRVLIGATAATGSHRAGRGGVPPLRFLRELACVDRRLRPLRVPECEGFRPLRADGWSHHPYTIGTTPDARSSHPDDVRLADTPRLVGLLDDLHERGRLEQRLDVFHTEYGYETNPPDPFRGIAPELQARHHAHASYLAWRDPRTRMFAQFLLQDVDPAESGARPGTPSFFRDWQSGLRYPDGADKPSLQAFRLPFWLDRVPGDGDHHAVMAWGQVRPGEGRQTVAIEERDARTGAWSAIPTVDEGSCEPEGPHFLTEPDGTFMRALPAAPRGELRFAWRRPHDGVWEPSPPIDPAQVLPDAPPGPPRP